MTGPAGLYPNRGRTDPRMGHFGPDIFRVQDRDGFAGRTGGMQAQMDSRASYRGLEGLAENLQRNPSDDKTVIDSPGSVARVFLRRGNSRVSASSFRNLFDCSLPLRLACKTIARLRSTAVWHTLDPYFRYGRGQN